MSNIVLPVNRWNKAETAMCRRFILYFVETGMITEDMHGHCQSPSEYHMRVFKLESRILLYCPGDM